MSPQRIAVIWSRFGPYHVARLAAAAKLSAAEGGEVAGIEVAFNDETYAWDPVMPCGGARHATLFPNARYESLSRGEIGAALFRELDRLAPDAVAVNGWSVAEAQAGIAWAARRNRPCILMSESKADDMPRLWWKERTKRWLLGYCDAALVGGAVHGDYLAALDFPRERVFHGYDVIDNAYFRSGAAAHRADPQNARAKGGLPEHYFFACTRFLPRKNVDGLLQAYALYRAQSPTAPWSLVIAGSGPEEARLRLLAFELGLSDVIWPGFVQYDRLPCFYGLASAFVHPAISEPWGLVVNEAIASGLSVVVSRSVGACRELVADGENGYVFDPLDAGDLARALQRMSGSSAPDRARMAQASLAIAARWEPERFGAGLLAAASLGKRAATLRRAA